MGLDVRALLLGAATMTKRFLEEPFERNPVLQYAAVNYLMTEELKKPTRVLAVVVEEAGGGGLVVRPAARGVAGQARPRADAAHGRAAPATCTAAASSTRTARATSSSTTWW